MNTVTFDSINVPESLNETLKYYLKEGEVYPIVIWDDDPIDVKIPQKMVFTVAESENYVKGDTVSGATKPIVTETGLTVRVPLFIKQDEKILVNTETNDYVERVNK
jgi:translation elongation factor P